LYSHGLGETPKLAIFLIPSGSYDDTDEGSFVDAIGQMSFGAMDGTRQWCGYGGVNDGGSSRNANRALHNDCCVITYDADTDAVIYKAGFSSWTSISFVLNWTVVGSTANTSPIYVILMSGSDFNAYVNTATMLTVTGTQDNTGVADGKALITWAGGAISSLNTITANAGFSLGFVDEAGNARARSCFANDAAANLGFYSDTNSALLTNDNTGAISVKATFVSHNPSGANSFRLNYTSPAGGIQRFGYVHLGGEGLRASAGHFTVAPNNTVSTTGTKPRVVLYTGNGVATVDSGTADDIMYSVGVGENESGEEQCIGFNINNTSGTCSSIASTGRALTHALAGGTTETNGIVELSNVDTAENFKTAKSSSGVDFVPFYLALGISPFTLVQKALSGSSADSGVLTKQQTVHSALSGASGNAGSLASRALDVIDSLLAGVSGCAGALSGLALHPVTLSGVSANAGAVVKLVKRSLTGSAVNQGVLGRATRFSAKWSIEHIVADTGYDFPAVYIEVDDTAMPSGAFPSGVEFHRKILQPLPELEELPIDEEGFLTGFNRLQFTVDNTDLTFLGKDVTGYYVRIWFVSGGGVYREFKGRISEAAYGFKTRITVEQIEAEALATKLPKRTVNDTLFTHANLPANDLGEPIPIIIGRQVKVRLLYLNADETNREYDYLIGEGAGQGGGNFEDVTTVYREDRALDSIEGTMAAAASTTLTLEAGDQRPGSWYKYWWVEMLTGNAAGIIRHVTAYDSANNRITIDSSWGTTPTSGTYRLREWRFYDGSQSSPYPGFAFIRFKKRMGEKGSTDTIYADVNGLQTERNPVRLAQGILSSPDWGLGLSVDTPSFDTAAGLSDMSAVLIEGELRNEADAVDVLKTVLQYRGMRLDFDSGITLSVDQPKTSQATLTQGGNSRIITTEPEKVCLNTAQTVKTLTVKYRRNGKTGEYMHTLSRPANALGVEKVVELPFVYSHETADRYCDYWRKRYLSFAYYIDLVVGEEVKTLTQGQAVTLDIPQCNIQDELWEIIQTRGAVAGGQSWRLIPYTDAYTYEPGTTESDVGFDIPPDYTLTNPDPVTGVSVTMSMGIVGFTAHPFALITWTPPEDNYGGAVVSVKLHSDATTLFRAVGTYTTSARIEGLVPGQLYDFLIESLNVTGELKGLGVTVNNSGAGYIAGGDSTAPATPAGLDGEAKHGKLVWTWNKNSESDVSHYIIEIYSATSGGSLLKRDIVPHENNASYTPGYEYQRQTGDLTSSLVGALRVAAVDHSGNTSGFTSRFGLSTGAVGRGDAVNNDFGKKWSARRDNAIALSSSVDVVTLSNVDVLAGDTVFIDASWTAHVTGGAANSYGCGFLVRRNGSTSLGRGTYFCFVDGAVGSYGSISITFSDQPGAGTHTYTINVFAISNVECFNAQLSASETRR
jgi:hypothetical protein